MLLNKTERSRETSSTILVTANTNKLKEKQIFDINARKCGYKMDDLFQFEVIRYQWGFFHTHDKARTFSELKFKKVAVIQSLCQIFFTIEKQTILLPH